MRIEEFFQKYRKVKGITQHELGELLGVTVYTVSRIESGRQETISERMLTKFASILSQEEIDMIEEPDEQLDKLKELATGIVNNTKKAANIGEFLKLYRGRHGLSQQDLAKMLRISLVTVARLETGTQATLSPKLVEKVADIIDDTDIATLNPSDPQGKRILEYWKTGQPKLPDYVSERSWSIHAIRGFSELAERIGYSSIDGRNGGLDDFTYRYQNIKNNKVWTIQFISDDCSKVVNTLKQYLVTRIGSALILGDKSIENKITIAIPNSYDEIKDQLKLHIPAYLPFDISILHFGDDGIIQQETCLRLNTDGRGIFDLDVDDTAVIAQAEKDYVAWTRAVGNIVMWEKTK